MIDEQLKKHDFDDWLESELPQDGWKLKEDAPDEIKKEYQDFMKKMDKEPALGRIY